MLAVGLGSLPLAACNVIAGLDRYEVSEACEADCGTGDSALDRKPDQPPSERSPSEDGLPADAADAGEASVWRTWARWRMPNPAGGEVDANLARYQVSNGVVRDLITSLEWQQDNEASCNDIESAEKVCEEAGWRLPTRIELATLIDYTQTPAIDPIFVSKESRSYWTASPVMTSDGPVVDGGLRAYWVIDFWYGAVFHDFTPHNYDLKVRCVRGGP
jgi:hypothetical protein